MLLIIPCGELSVYNVPPDIELSSSRSSNWYCSGSISLKILIVSTISCAYRRWLDAHNMSNTVRNSALCELSLSSPIKLYK